jgi:two-component system sensor histidine kinase PilS (NtrC family)
MRRKISGMDGLRRSLRFLVTIRLIVMGTIVLSSILIQATAGLALPLTYLYGVAVLAVSLSLLHGYTAGVLRPRVDAYVQLCGDLVLVTALVYFSGGSDSVFTFFYLIVVGAASFLLLRPGGLLVASLASVLYGLMIEFSFYGVLPPPPLSQAPSWSGPGPLVSLVVNIVAFYSVAVLTALIAEKLSSARSEIVARRSEIEKMRALHADVIESMSSGLATVDPGGRITFLNPAGGELLVMDPAGAVGRRLWDVGLLSEGEWQQARAGLEGGDPPRGETSAVLAGRSCILGYSVRPLKGTTGLLLLFQDLTEWKRLEEESRSREKLAAVGKLAAGIAHEIRNPLASISGSAQMLGNDMRDGSSERRLMEIIVSESKRLSKTLEEFLRYARPRPQPSESFDIARSLVEAMDLFCNSDEVSDRHRLELRVEPPSSRVWGNPDSIRQIFWNIAKNAVRAMPGGGQLSVSGEEDGPWYRITFQDTGRGMTAEERDALFQPFATAFDGGTGLGMAIVRRLTEDHGGRIRVESQPGLGTRIEIRLPRGDARGASFSAA